MRISRYAGLAGLVLLAGLAGCGGGSSVAVTSISGRVLAPDAQAVHSRGTTVVERPLADALVKAVDLSDGHLFATTRTDGSGNFAVSGVTAGANYRIDVTPPPSMPLPPLQAIVTPAPGANTATVDPASTVAAIAVADRLAASPPLASTDLGSMASELAKTVDTAPLAGVLDPDALIRLAHSLNQEALPAGTFTGEYNDASAGRGLVSILFIDRNYLIALFRKDATGALLGATWTTGSLDQFGSMNASLNDGTAILVGSFWGAGGTVQLRNTNPVSRCTVRLVRQTKDYAGLYSGGLVEDQEGARPAMFVASVLDNKHVYAFDALGHSAADFGVGLLDSSNHLTMVLFRPRLATDDWRPSVLAYYLTSEGAPSGHSFAGSYVSLAGQTGRWGGSTSAFTTWDDLNRAVKR